MAVKITHERQNQIGEIIWFHRKQAGLSREALSELSGVGKTAIYDIEHGKETVRFKTLMSVFDVLNISVTLNSPLMNQIKE